MSQSTRRTLPRKRPRRTKAEINEINKAFEAVSGLALECMPLARAKRGITQGTRDLIASAFEILEERHPMTLRGLHYQMVVRAIYSNERKNYVRLSRAMVKARESGDVPWEWIVDSIRATLKPSSWSGLDSFMRSVKHSYRKAFWPRQPDYVCFFCEKDAMASAIEPATAPYDVALHVVRGYKSASYAHAIAQQWKCMDKGVYCYYLGDFDASGMDLERDLRESLARYSGREEFRTSCADLLKVLPPEQVGFGADTFRWERLGVNASDFEEFELVPMLAKKTDSRYRKFVERHGHDCAELDALPVDVLRDRVEQAILSHIDPDEWSRLLAVEQAEQATLDQFVAAMAGGKP